MLVLTRRFQEKIRIGDEITITVLKMKGKAVRLGIEAPAEIPVIRGELAAGAAPVAAPESSEIVRTCDPTDLSSTGRRTPGGAERAPRGGATWNPAGRPQSATRLPIGSSPTTVSLHRVPRDKAGQALSELTTGRAPLRPMMDQRPSPV